MVVVTSISIHGCGMLPTHLHSPARLETSKAAQQTVEILTKDDFPKRIRSADDELSARVIESLLGARSELARVEAERMTYKTYTFDALEAAVAADVGSGISTGLVFSSSVVLARYEQIEGSMDQVTEWLRKLRDTLKAASPIDWDAVAVSLRKEGDILRKSQLSVVFDGRVRTGGVGQGAFKGYVEETLLRADEATSKLESGEKKRRVEGLADGIEGAIRGSRVAHALLVARGELREAAAVLATDPNATGTTEAESLKAARELFLAAGVTLADDPIELQTASLLRADLLSLASKVITALSDTSVVSTLTIAGQRRGLDVLSKMETAEGVLKRPLEAPRRQALVDTEEELSKQVEAARKARSQFQRALDELMDGLDAALKFPEREIKVQRLQSEISDLERRGAAESETKPRKDALAKLGPEGGLRAKLERGLEALGHADLPEAATVLGPVVQELAAEWEKWKSTFEKARQLKTPQERLFYLEVLLEQVRRDLALLVEEERAALERQRLHTLLAERKARALVGATKVREVVKQLRKVDAKRFSGTEPLRDAIVAARVDAVNPSNTAKLLDGQDQLRDVLGVALLALQIRVTLAAEMRAITARAAFLEKQHKTFQHEIQLKYRYGLIRVSVDSLAAYHHGGLKPEHIGQIMSILQAAGIAVIAF